MTLKIMSWIAVVLVSSSFWFQIWKIHRHREVRDLSIVYYLLLIAGFIILGLAAYAERTWIFMIKQIATLVPSLIIIAQILVHRGDRYHDENLPLCTRCNEELEPNWGFCPFCSQPTESF